jgi:IS5 family transposase
MYPQHHCEPLLTDLAVITPSKAPTQPFDHLSEAYRIIVTQSQAQTRTPLYESDSKRRRMEWRRLISSVKTRPNRGGRMACQPTKNIWGGGGGNTTTLGPVK